MSFDWNLSSEDEFDDEVASQGPEKATEFPDFTFEHDEKCDETRNQIDPSLLSANESLGRASIPPTDNGFTDQDDEDEVDWEDVGDDEDEDDAVVSTPLRPIAFDMDSKPSATENRNKKSRRRIRQVYKFKSLSLGMQQLLQNLHRSHLLSLLSRSVLISRCCSDHVLLHVALSLVPIHVSTNIEINKNENNVPTTAQLRDFCNWYFDFVHQVEQRRRQQLASNAAAGAPRAKRHKGVFSTWKRNLVVYGNGTTSPEHLIDVCAYLSAINDENPQLLHDNDSIVCMTGQDNVQLFVAMVRALGWRARHVTAIDPMKCDLDLNHPLLLAGVGNVFSAVKDIHDQDKKQPAKQQGKRPIISLETDAIPLGVQLDQDSSMVWAEIICQPTKQGQKSAKKYRWIHVDPANQLIDRPRLVESYFHTRKFDGVASEKKKRTIVFALAVEHLPAESIYGGIYNLARLTDVTRRYANSWSKSLRLREDGNNVGIKSWWDDTLDRINFDARYQATWVCGDIFGPRKHFLSKSNACGVSKMDAIELGESSEDDGYDRYVDEHEELTEFAGQETMPTSKAGFKNHPIYVLASQLGIAEVFSPDANARFCGMFKGELVFRRSEVSTARDARRWLYEGRKVKDDEMGKPIKRVKARKKPTPTTFQALNSYGVGQGNDGSEEARQKEIEKAESSQKEEDGMKDLYAIWQTKPWSPAPVGPDDKIPINEYRNVELALINPGLIHLDAPRMSIVAKNLGIPYAPCLLGFEGRGGNRTPTIKGIVVHGHNGELLMEAYAEYEFHGIEQEHQIRKNKILRRWKTLIQGILIKSHVDREYGDDDKVTL